MKLRLFSLKNDFQIPCKIFTIQCFLNNHLKHKIVNKATCRTISAHQLCAHYFQSFPTAMTIFPGFQDFLIYLATYFLSLLNSPNMIFQLPFCKSKWHSLISFFVMQSDYTISFTLEISKCLTWFQNILAFSTTSHLQAAWRI